MGEINMDQLVAAVTAEVWRALQAQEKCTSAADEGKERVLVIGDPAHLPEEVSYHAQLCCVKDYERNRSILLYKRVIIEHLKTDEMIDIAQGRSGSLASAIVVEAILNGIEVVMTQDAPEHRKYAGKASGAFYQMLENYARTLSIFGIKQLTSNPVQPTVPAAPPKFQAPKPERPRGNAMPSIDRLITEDAARKLAEDAADTVCLPAGTILTPSARDVFAQARLEIRWEG